MLDDYIIAIIVCWFNFCFEKCFRSLVMIKPLNRSFTSKYNLYFNQEIDSSNFTDHRIQFWNRAAWISYFSTFFSLFIYLWLSEIIEMMTAFMCDISLKVFGGVGTTSVFICWLSYDRPFPLWWWRHPQWNFRNRPHTVQSLVDLSSQAPLMSTAV